MSLFGHWKQDAIDPEFSYTADPRTDVRTEWDPRVEPKTRRHIHVTGNERLTALVDNHGTVSLLDEVEGLRMLTRLDPVGTGATRVLAEGSGFGTDLAHWPEQTPEQGFSIDGGTVRVNDGRLAIQRRLTFPEGAHPWVGVDLLISNLTDRPITVEIDESWDVEPEWLSLEDNDDEIAWHGPPAEAKLAVARRHVRFEPWAGDREVLAREIRVDADQLRADQIFGSPVLVRLQYLDGEVDLTPHWSADPHPTLSLRGTTTLSPSGSVRLRMRFGIVDDSTRSDALRTLDGSRERLLSTLPTIPQGDPELQREMRWHVATLIGATCVDSYLGGHTLNQGSTYLWKLGENAAARDPIQHALPLIYTHPQLALSVLRNTFAWASPEGELPYLLTGAKGRWNKNREPSDQNLWSLLFAAEYLAATGDFESLDTVSPFHPEYRAAPVTLREHLRLQHRYFIDQVGLGEHGHVRMLNADWNDMAIEESAVDRDVMWARGESVLNTAMASTVLPIWAGAAERLGFGSEAQEARVLAEQLRQTVAGEWNGQWFRRAYGPGADPVGERDMWLEVQPWALLCGAATDAQARTLIDVLEEGARKNSPIGCRLKWPLLPQHRDDLWPPGEGTWGGTWFSINMTLVWALARYDRAKAWDEFHRMTLRVHERTYPDQWAGTLSGPDSYNSPEADRPGESWTLPVLHHAMQAFPVGNMHSHCQPVMSYLRLLGVEPATDGALLVGSGEGSWRSRVLELREDGHGALHARGPVTVRTPTGDVQGSGSTVTW